MSSGDSTTRPGSEAWFVTTRWSIVLSAQAAGDTAEAGAALETLCRTYWYPLYAYARRSTQSPADAEDLVQGFFAKVISKDYLKTAARERGKFRSFLLMTFKRFMANEWDREHAQKRGGFSTTVPIDTDLAESRFASEGSHNSPPDVLFDRQWATALLERTIARLEEEYVATGRARLFELLRDCLSPDETALAYAAIAAKLNLTEAAVKMAVHRLRARYRVLIREEIAQTVTSASEVEEEIRHLFEAFAP